jgi:hypothetical protein
MRRPISTVPGMVLVTVLGATSCAYTERPSRRDCEAAIDNVVAIEAGKRAGGGTLGRLAGIVAPTAARVTGRRERAVARCEVGWNRHLADCARTAETRGEIESCRAWPWSDPIAIPR